MIGHGCRALFALQIALTVGATSASAQVFAGIDPVDDNGTLWVAKVAPQAAGLPEHFTFKASFWIENTGAVEVRVTEYEIDYLDSGIPPITVPKNTLVEPGKTKQLKIGHEVMPTQALPLPDLAMITVRFDNRAKIVKFVRMAFYANATETGRRLFPMDAADLGPGQYWHLDRNHVHNDASLHQRYGYDLGVKRWSGLSWTNLKPGTSGAANSDYLAYGQPIYAVADGSVVACRRGIPDNVVGESGSGGGNFLWIQHGDELIYYAHFAQNTVDGFSARQN